MSSASRRAIPWRFLALSFVTLAGALSYTFLPEEPRPRALAFIALQFLLVLPALAAWRLGRDGGIGLRWILAAALVVRVACLPGELIFENDVFRYLWDGRVSAAGINPYRYPPAAPELTALQDDWVFPQIPYRQVPTAYPPLAELLFWLARTLFGESVFGLQALMIFLDCLTVWVLWALGRNLGAPGAAAAYALHPLVIKEFSQAGHIDAAAVLLATTAALLLIQKRPRWAAAALAGATLVKVFPFFLLPAVARRLGWANLALYLAIVAAPLLAVIALGAWPFAGLGTFSRYWIFNPSLYDLVVRALSIWVAPEQAFAAARVVCGGVLAVALGIIFSRTRPSDDRNVLTAMLASTLALLLCSPAANPWYLTWLVPLGLVLGSRPSVALSFLASLAYAFYLDGRDLPWTRLVEYAPVYGLLLIGWLRFRSAVSGQKSLPGRLVGNDSIPSKPSREG